MKISCPSCEAKYSIGDDKVQSRLAKIRCRKCGVDIVIDGRVQPPTVTVGDSAASPETMQAAAAATQSYTIDFGENDQRTMTLEEVVAAYNAGYVTPETFVWADGMSDWTPLGQVAEIVDALNAAATSAVQASNTATAARPQTTTTATATAAAARTAARTSAVSSRGGADLFGALARAGGEEDMDRQAATSAGATAQQAASGVRNESSVLFSLSALTSSAKSAPTQSHALTSSSAASREDSGLIDLKALTAQASSDAAAANVAVGLAAPSPLGGLAAPLGALGAPLGGAPAMPGGLAAPALADVSYPQKKNRMGLFIGGGVAIGFVAIALAIVLKPEPPPPPKVEPAPVIVYKTREPEPIKENAAKPPPTGEAAATSAPTAAAAAPKAPSGGGAKWRPKAKSSGSGEKESGSSAPAAPTPKTPSASKCGCAPGDLACNMRCAAKG